MGLKQVYRTWMSVFSQWNFLTNGQEPRWRGTLFCSRYLGSFGLCFASQKPVPIVFVLKD
ncbi:hypothetical protein CASFOL_017642 [Castilleja foliolosa]|uniref:Uncharacterized protein n=1 Tax=Castilleja foliolosa TaxID=1961234 RepID=A0ABD3D7I4_9LAMI